MSDPAIFESEFDVLIAKAGLTIPEERRKAILSGYAELRRKAELLRTMDITHVNEPANIYGFDPILRGAAE